MHTQLNQVQQCKAYLALAAALHSGMNETAWCAVSSKRQHTMGVSLAYEARLRGVA